jgi:hypothetical protein
VALGPIKSRTSSGPPRRDVDHRDQDDEEADPDGDDDSNQTEDALQGRFRLRGAVGLLAGASGCSCGRADGPAHAARVVEVRERAFDPLTASTHQAASAAAANPPAIVSRVPIDMRGTVVTISAVCVGSSSFPSWL